MSDKSKTFIIEPTLITEDKIFFRKTLFIKEVDDKKIVSFTKYDGVVSGKIFKNNLKIKNDEYYIPLSIVSKTEYISEKSNSFHPFLISNQFPINENVMIDNNKALILLNIMDQLNNNKLPSSESLKFLDCNEKSLNEKECCELCKYFSVLLTIVKGVKTSSEVINSEEIEKIFFNMTKALIRYKTSSILLIDTLSDRFSKLFTNNRRKHSDTQQTNTFLPPDINNYIQIDIKKNMSIINNPDIFIWKGIAYLPFRVWLSCVYVDLIRNEDVKTTQVKESESFKVISTALENLIPKKIISDKKQQMVIPEKIPSIEEAIEMNLFPPCMQSWIKQLKKIGCHDPIRRSTKTFLDLGYTIEQVEQFFLKNGATDKNIKEINAWTQKVKQNAEMENRRHGVNNKSCGKRCPKLISDARNNKGFGKNGTHYTCPLVDKKSLSEYLPDIEDLGKKLTNVVEDSIELCCFYFDATTKDRTEETFDMKSPTHFFIKKLNATKFH